MAGILTPRMLADALDSGKFQQCRDQYFKMEDGKISYCVRGLAACLVDGPPTSPISAENGSWPTRLPHVAWGWLEDLPLTRQGNSECLRSLNDAGLTFPQLADVIRYCYPEAR
jgi:hypothetical protein